MHALAIKHCAVAAVRLALGNVEEEARHQTPPHSLGLAAAGEVAVQLQGVQQLLELLADLPHFQHGAIVNEIVLAPLLGGPYKIIVGQLLIRESDFGSEQSLDKRPDTSNGRPFQEHVVRTSSLFTYHGRGKSRSALYSLFFVLKAPLFSLFLLFP